MEIMCAGHLITNTGKHAVQSASEQNQELKIFTLNFCPYHYVILKFLQKQQYTNKILTIYQHNHQCLISGK
jgi:hypothetical protein